MDCFHSLNDDWKLECFGYASVSPRSPVLLKKSGFGSSAAPKWALCRQQTVVKTHHMSRVWQKTRTMYLKYSHTKSRLSLPGTVKSPGKLELLLLLHGTNNEKKKTIHRVIHTIMFSLCHASSLQYCCYISLLYYTEPQIKSEQVHVGLATNSARLTSTAGFTVGE